MSVTKPVDAELSALIDASREFFSKNPLPDHPVKIGARNSFLVTDTDDFADEFEDDDPNGPSTIRISKGVIDPDEVLPPESRGFDPLEPEFVRVASKIRWTAPTGLVIPIDTRNLDAHINSLKAMYPDETVELEQIRVKAGK